MRHIIFAILVAVPTALITWVISRGNVTPQPSPAVADTRTAPAAKQQAPPAAAGSAEKAAVPSAPDAALHGLFIESLAGAKPSSEVTLYDNDGLFEYINGAAPLFIARGFRRLAAADMVTKDGAEMVCDVYDMVMPENAAAIFAAEQPRSTANGFKLGDEARKGSMALVFRKGPYYVKLTAFDAKAEAELEAVARTLISRMP